MMCVVYFFVYWSFLCMRLLFRVKGRLESFTSRSFMMANIMLLIFLPSHFLKLKYNMGRIDEKLRKTEKMTEQ